MPKTIRKIVKINEALCDGCGACIIACSEGALKIIDGKARLVSEKYCDGLGNCLSCPRGAISIEEREVEDFDEDTAGASRLGHWPVQLALVSPDSPFFKDAELVLSAHCVPFAYSNFHRDFLGEDKALVVACPKLDDFPAHQAKLNEILKKSGITSLTVLRMEVPCCSGLVYMAKQAILNSGKSVPLSEKVIGVRGQRLAG
jgi:NAD-dependent dihydropyrimidine dehydrogenase PreA subunit